MFKKHKLLLPIKSHEVTSFRKECNELLLIRFLILCVIVPLQLLVTDIQKVTETVLVTTKNN
jgi:hypothetical protein